MEERDKLDLVKLILGGVLVAIILSLAFVRIVEPIHRFFYETEECKLARDVVKQAHESVADGYSEPEQFQLLDSYSSYYNAFCKYPFEFPRG